MAPIAEESHLDHDTDEPAQAADGSPQGSPKSKKQHHSKYEHASSGEDHGLHRKPRRKKQA
jgi:hypothetical protein